MAQEQAVEFVPLLNPNDYEILNIYTFTLRRKKDKFKVIESVQGTNYYIQLLLNKKPYFTHRIIALQFIPNPDNQKFLIVKIFCCYLTF